MSKYKLSTGLWTVNETPEFDTDMEAWEYLRKQLPGKYATLYKRTELSVPINNEQEYISKHNAKYGPPPIGYGGQSAVLLEVGMPYIITEWVPVLVGITDDEYNIST